MLESLHLKNVGPSADMRVEFAPRINLITGDNGLGKSFLLDVAWWALTRRWPQDLNTSLTSGYAARPTDVKVPASISLRVLGKTGNSVQYDSPYVPTDQAWRGKQGRPWNPGLVLYALAVGGFAVWDPLRNYWRQETNADVQERLPAYVFAPKDVWDGLVVDVQGKSTTVCNGLLADWASWIRERGPDALRMAEVLRVLSPIEGQGAIEPASNFARLSVDDARDIPMIRMGYGEIPILHASLGMRRVVALAYMMSWAWREHQIAARLLGDVPGSRIVLLFDEIEAHLHPRWQRVMVPALLEVTRTLTQDPATTVQLIAATHSPLVLASVETRFDPERDKLFSLELGDDGVSLRELPWAKQGDVVNWLASDSFGLLQGRSLEAERAIEAAEAWMRGDGDTLPSTLSTQAEIHKELLRVLPPHDDFWPGWVVSTQLGRKPA